MKKIFNIFLIAACAVPVLTSCSDDDDVSAVAFNPAVVKTAPDFVDARDNNVYTCVQIGDQIWMAENLRYSLPLNAMDGSFTWGEEIIDPDRMTVPGDVFCDVANKVKDDPQYDGWSQYGFSFQAYIPMYLDYVESGMMSSTTVMSALGSLFPLYADAVNEELKSPATMSKLTQAHFEEADENNGGYASEYGLLYTYEGALAAVPDGWRLPSDEDWMKLEMTLGMSADEAKKVNEWRGAGLASVLNWGGASKFNAMFAGCSLYNSNPKNEYDNKDSNWYFWTSTKYDNSEAVPVSIIRMSAIFSDKIWKGESRLTAGDRALLYSVRCVKDAR